MTTTKRISWAGGVLLLAAQTAQAWDWSDTSVGWSHGNRYAEPFNTRDISKNIYSFTHADGYRYGTNFLNIDRLQSDSTDRQTDGSGARETYVVYRHTLDLGKVTDKNLSVGPVRGVGLTAGFDWNNKNDAGYASKKRMLVLGPTLMFDVPGFLNLSLLWMQESNRPVGVADRYTYRTHPMLSAAWSIPVGSDRLPLFFTGYGNWIASKGKNEFGGDTATETNIDMKLLLDVGAASGGTKGHAFVGIGYQYWHNKFGNLPSVSGSTANTPYIRAEYHF